MPRQIWELKQIERWYPESGNGPPNWKRNRSETNNGKGEKKHIPDRFKKSQTQRSSASLAKVGPPLATTAKMWWVSFFSLDLKKNIAEWVSVGGIGVRLVGVVFSSIFSLKGNIKRRAMLVKFIVFMQHEPEAYAKGAARTFRRIHICWRLSHSYVLFFFFFHKRDTEKGLNPPYSIIVGEDKS